MATPLDPDSGLQKIELAYDFMSRRVRKVVSSYDGSAWNQEQETLFVYDGWNLLRETTTTDSGTSTEYYVWGLDLSGTLHGAGGVGGLLSKTNDQASQTFQYLYDANGNVGQLLNAADGSLAAHYEYDPFGNVLVADGSEALKNSIRFSTKFFDIETGWYYYGHRYYDPVSGRWPTRDPIGEMGSVNLYLFVGNDAIHGIDSLGLEPYTEKTQTKLQEIAPLVQQNLEAALPSWAKECTDLYQAVALKFIADEYDARKRMFGLKGGIDEYYQDWRARHGYLTPAGTQSWEFVKMAEQFEHWKEGNIIQEFLLKTWNIQYHDLGPANIEIKTALGVLDMKFEELSTTEILAIMKFLTTDEGTAIFSLYFAAESIADLNGHFCSCEYDRGKIEILLQRIRRGEKRFWKQTAARRKLTTAAQIEKWRKGPYNFPGVLPLEPLDIDNDKFTFIETLVK